MAMPLKIVANFACLSLALSFLKQKKGKSVQVWNKLNQTDSKYRLSSASRLVPVLLS
jgi:hypothetical protein